VAVLEPFERRLARTGGRTTGAEVDPGVIDVGRLRAAAEAEEENVARLEVAQADPLGARQIAAQRHRRPASERSGERCCGPHRGHRRLPPPAA
jgi:hypothetical protein